MGKTMIDIGMLSSVYDVRKLGGSDVDDILRLCQENTQFYQYCDAKPSREQILSDMRLLPPGIGQSDKYYIGFYQNGILIAVMDLVDGYPESCYAFIGFFMMRKELQGRNIGSAIIQTCSEYLKTIGKTVIRLAIDQANPQSTHFWKKNGFAVVQEVNRDGWTILVADKALCKNLIGWESI